MLQSPCKQVQQFIHNAISSFLADHPCESMSQLECHSEIIFRLTLLTMANHFLEKKFLRQCEKITVKTLKSDLDRKLETEEVERHLNHHLRKITPVLGELFGTYRGPVVDCFLALKKWNIFSYRQRVKFTMQLAESKTDPQSQEQSQTNTLLQQQDETNTQLVQRCTKQYLEILSLKQKIKELESQTQTTSTTSTSFI